MVCVFIYYVVQAVDGARAAGQSGPGRISGDTAGRKSATATVTLKLEVIYHWDWLIPFYPIDSLKFKGILKKVAYFLNFIGFCDL